TTPPVTATISGAPVGATIRYSLDGSAYTTYTGPFPVSGEGIHFILATDDQNDMGATVVPIDTTAPTVSASLQPDPDPTSGWNSGTTTVTLKAVDGGGSGVTQTIWTATGAQPGNATVNGDTAQIVISNDGQTTITFHAVDSVGHIGPTNQITVKVDTGAPVVQCGSADGQWHAANVSITCTASDAGSGLHNPADQSFTRQTTVNNNTADANASTGSHIVCDQLGKCVTAGPISGNKVDRQPPTIAGTIVPGTSISKNDALGQTWW